MRRSPTDATNILVSHAGYKSNDESSEIWLINLFYSHQINTVAIMLYARILISATSLLALAAALPATSPDDDDFECFSSYSAYTSSSWEVVEQYITEVWDTYTSLSTIVDRNVSMTTLCDGRPRALEPYRTSEVTLTYTYDEPLTFTVYSEYTSPSPTCTVDATACAAIKSAHPNDNAHCDIPGPPATRVACTAIPDYCFIYAAGALDLLYWPVNTVSGDFCAQNGSTVFAEPTSPPEPNKVVRDGYTFTSPTNYLSFQSIDAVLHGERRKQTACGPGAHSNVIVPITESFYSMGYKDSEQHSFNFGDLPPNTIPVSAYNRQRKCGYEHTCSGVIQFEEDYTPILPLPTEMLNLEPEGWKDAGCKGTGDGFYVNPVPLQTPAPTARSKLLL